MGRLCLTATEVYEDLVRLGRSVFRSPLDIPDVPLFDVGVLSSSIIEILESHGFSKDIKMVDDTTHDEQCHA